MKSILLKLFAACALLIFVGILILINLWRENDHYPSPDLPWNGPNSKPVEQYRPAFSPFSPTPQTKDRWYSSRRHKPNSNYYGSVIDDFIEQHNLHAEWPGGGSVWYGGDVIDTKESPRKIIFSSINPLVVFMTKPDPEGTNLTERGRFVSSMILSSHYYYATSFPYDPATEWFMPEDGVLPSKLGLSPGETKTIELHDSQLIITVDSSKYSIERK